MPTKGNLGQQGVCERHTKILQGYMKARHRWREKSHRWFVAEADDGKVAAGLQPKLAKAPIDPDGRHFID